MQTEVYLRICTRVGRDLGKPWARHHDAAGIHEARFQCFNCRDVDRVSHAEIVGMNDQKFRVTRIPEPFGYSLVLSTSTSNEQKRQQSSNKYSSHGAREYPIKRILVPFCGSTFWSMTQNYVVRYN